MALSLTRSSTKTSQNSTLTPYPEYRRKVHGDGEEPNENDGEDNVAFGVDALVRVAVSDHHVPEVRKEVMRLRRVREHVKTGVSSFPWK